jgi:hypothetical protein
VSEVELAITGAACLRQHIKAYREAGGQSMIAPMSRWMTIGVCADTPFDMVALADESVPLKEVATPTNAGRTPFC